MKCRIRKSLRKLYIAFFGGLALNLYTYYRFIFVDGWNWQDPVAELPRILPAIGITLVLMLLANATTEIELEVQ